MKNLDSRYAYQTDAEGEFAAQAYGPQFRHDRVLAAHGFTAHVRPGGIDVEVTATSGYTAHNYFYHAKVNSETALVALANLVAAAQTPDEITALLPAA